MNEMQKWLKNYMNERHPKNLREPNPGWQSSKYDFSDPDVRLEYVPEMDCTVGGCISALKKSWRAFKVAGRNGEPRADLAYRINFIKNSLGLPLSDFGLEGMSYNEFGES